MADNESSKTMIIENSSLRLIGLGYRQEKQRKTLNLKPGANEVDPEVWGLASDTDVVRSLMDEGTIVAPTATARGSGKAAGEAAASLKELNPRDAVTLVNKTIDVPLLTKWGKSEDRKDVSAAIEKQLKKIETGDDKK